MHRRALTAALASATVALGGALAVTTVPSQAADPVSPLVLDAPDRVVARSHHGWVYSDLGVQMVAQGEDFRIEATRSPSGGDLSQWWDPSYNSPIMATWKRGAGDESLGEMTSWSGLDDFATVKIFRPSDGKRIRNIRAAGCFNGEAHKVGPLGPVSNPFPWGCPWNAYTLGSVMGVAQDYSSSLLPEWGTNLRLKPGTYRLVAGIAPEWAERFDIAEADATVTTKLVVKKARDRWRSSATVSARGTDDLEATTEAPTTSSAGELVDQYAPDLRSLPAFDISLNGKGTAMRFGATVWNGGAGPMVIEGFREDHEHDDEAPTGDHTDHMTAYQYYFDGNGNQTGFDQVGQFGYHAANHNHWHFEDFARYRLFAADPANEDQPGELAVKSTKASFCLVATDAVDLTVPNPDMRPEYTDLGSQCGGRNAESLREVLANGHGDTYHQFRAGQAFRIGNVPDGKYFISVEANPADEPGAENDGRNLKELDLTNNDSLRKVRIWTTPKGVRKVKAYQVGMIEEYGFEEFRTR
jgi:hypothetical protein